MRLTYDAQKRRLTLENRGLDFEDADQIFSGFHLSRIDNRNDYGEVREITVGLISGVVVVVVWTQRGDSRRIISMRKADRDEREGYFREMG